MEPQDDYASETKRDYFRDLRIIGATAIVNSPTFLFQVFGFPWDRPAPSSEFSPDRERDLGWMVKYLTRMWTLKTPWTGWSFLEQEPMSVVRDITHDESEVPAPGEAWFFINGILTDQKIGLLNARRLSELFRRPITLLSNPTYNIAFDLHECINGRTLDQPSAPAVYFASVIQSSLLKGNRVVLLAHSQGTIIAANIVHLLIRSGATEAELRRLELYLFASATARIPGFGECDEAMVPAVEHFVNENDLVPKISINYRGSEELNVRGRVCFRRGKYGHVLNANYLDNLDAYRPVSSGAGDRHLWGAEHDLEVAEDEALGARDARGKGRDTPVHSETGVADSIVLGESNLPDSPLVPMPRLLAYRDGGSPRGL